MPVLLTARQQEILEFIQAFVREQVVPPTIREIGERFGLDPHAVYNHLKALERKGCLARGASKARSLRLVGRAQERAGRPIPVLGRVHAGLPLLAVENLDGFLPVAEEWLGGAEAFCLQVKGESMIGVGILDGDYVVVRRQETAEDGDIVVALLDDEATVKRFRRWGRGVFLVPEHPSMASIEVKAGEEIHILGKVIGVLRRL